MPKRIEVKGTIVSDDVKWIYDYFGIKAVSPSVIQDGLEEANGDDVVIVVNSGGGSVIAGHEMYTTVRSYKGNVSFEIIYAGSAASVVTQAAKSVISPVGLFMIHNCASSASGDYREMDKTSNLLQTINQTIRNSYKAKTKLSDEELIKLMDGETWMTAEDAVKNGFVDSIMFEDTSDDNPSNYVNSATLDRKDFCESVILDSHIIDKMRSQKLDDLSKDVGSNTPGAIVNSGSLPGEINTNKITKEVTNTMTLDEFLNQDAAANQEMNQRLETAKNEGIQEGITNERERIKAIDNIAKSIAPDKVTDAKYTKPVTAAELALQVVSDSAKAGKEYFVAAVDDSKKSRAEEVETTPEEVQDESEDEALINCMVNGANGKRGGNQNGVTK